MPNPQQTPMGSLYEGMRGSLSRTNLQHGTFIDSGDREFLYVTDDSALNFLIPMSEVPDWFIQTIGGKVND